MGADAWLKGEYDTGKQAELCNRIAVALGFDLAKGRLDVSVHPFTGGAQGDGAGGRRRGGGGQVVQAAEQAEEAAEHAGRYLLTLARLASPLA